MSLIEVDSLHFAYRTSEAQDVPILKDISLRIEDGEMVAIQGPSGSGKSTLLYILGALQTAYQGAVRIAGQDLSRLSDYERARLRNESIGFVFQQFHLLPKAIVAENISLPHSYPTEAAKPHLADREKIRKLAATLGIEAYLDRRPNQLSGGQQQRVAIARALYNNPRIILADEPTGSLDSQNSQQIVDILKEANRAGRTVIIITHDPEVAKQCSRVIHVRDGRIADMTTPAKPGTAKLASPAATRESAASTSAPLRESLWNLPVAEYLRTGTRLAPLAAQSLKQNKSRSFLTMMGIVIGVSAVLAMITLGNFTKRKILDSYNELGVNSMNFYGYPNWELRATDDVSTPFQSFNWDTDIKPLRKMFPQIAGVSPVLYSWDSKAAYGGKVMDTEMRVVGVSEDGLRLSNRKVVEGKGISYFHVANRSPVCVIGPEIRNRLFQNIDPLGQFLYITQRDSAYGCQVIGILDSMTSNKDWNKPDSQIYVPYTFFQGISDPWSSKIMNLIIQVKPGTNIEVFGKGLKTFFERKYGKSAMFNVGSDSLLIAQMNRFLSLFTLMLAIIALVSLAVGGIGITNMMLVSISERLKEIGIRKAFGATNFSIRVQYLVESILICGAAGVVGLVFGFIAYQFTIYGASLLVPQVRFEWVFDGTAISVAIESILAVGLLSGLIPAFRAEKLQVIDALRSE